MPVLPLLEAGSCALALPTFPTMTQDAPPAGGSTVLEALALGRSFFLSEQRRPLHRSPVNLLLHKYGEKARLPVTVHPHMLWHACGFALADQGADTRLIQDYLVHRNIQHTVRYTASNPARFKKLWR